MFRPTPRLLLYAVLTLAIGMFTLGAAPANANLLTSANATVTCTGYTISFTAGDLYATAGYKISWTITLTPTGGGAPITINDAVSGIDGVGNTGDDYSSGSLTFPLFGLTGPYTLSGTATLSSISTPPLIIDAPATIPIVFSNTGATLAACTAPPPGGTGRFTGGGKQVDVDGVTIKKGLELDCDLMGSNNLEINWQDSTGTHQFHMLDFTFANCFLNPAFSPTPPFAPINTMIGKGTGRFDNTDGYTVEFTLEDHGEPGGNDRAGFKVYLTANPSVVVLTFPIQVLTDGNLQAHVDQH
jgi:hypothetical protein